jgi:hypothetical protein
MAPVPKPKETIPVVTKSLKDVIAAKKVKPKEEKVIEIIEFKKPDDTITELNKALKEEIVDFIRKEAKKVVAMMTEELISEEARASAKRVATEALEKAAESYKWKVKELSDVSYEHLSIPLGAFRSSMLDKLGHEGWKMITMFTGECAKVSGYKTDVVLFTRVKSEKWPKAPEFK